MEYVKACLCFFVTIRFAPSPRLLQQLLYTSGLATHPIEMHVSSGMSISLLGNVSQLKCPLELPLWVLEENSG
jgi:hypothetical protein